MFQHFLVPLDGSSLAEAVLPLTHMLACCLHARITLLHVTERHAPATIHGEHHLGSTQEAETYLGTLAQRWSQGEAHVDWHVHDDQPHGVAQMIVDQAAELNADLIVMATHGRMGLDAFWSASVAPKVLHEFVGPLLLLRAEAAAQ